MDSFVLGLDAKLTAYVNAQVTTMRRTHTHTLTHSLRLYIYTAASHKLAFSLAEKDKPNKQTKQTLLSSYRSTSIKPKPCVRKVWLSPTRGGKRFPRPSRQSLQQARPRCSQRWLLASLTTGKVDPEVGAIWSRETFDSKYQMRRPIAPRISKTYRMPKG